MRGIGLDLTRPDTIRDALADVGPVRYLVELAIDRDDNRVADYSIERAIRLVTLKLVGYTEVIHALRDRLDDDSAIVLFGGLAKDRPYPGSTTVSTVNGGIVGLVRTLVGRAGADPRQRTAPRNRGRLTVLEGQVPRPHRRPNADEAPDPDGGHRRRRPLPAREPGRQRDRPARRRRLDDDVTVGGTDATRSARPDYPDIGEQLRARRQELGLSLRQLAERLGVSASLISQIETGRANPSVSTLYQLVAELDVSLDELLFNERRGADRAAGEAAPQPARSSAATTGTASDSRQACCGSGSRPCRSRASSSST